MAAEAAGAALTEVLGLQEVQDLLQEQLQLGMLKL